MTSWKTRAPASLVVPGTRGESNGGSIPLHMTPLPENLLSPVDPGFLEGASSSARFGLDIGGTLCKVVFFEPILNAEIRQSVQEMAKTRLGWASNEDKCITPSAHCNGDSKTEKCSAHAHSGNGTSAVEDLTACNCDGATPKVESYLHEWQERGEESKRDSSRQAHNMWVSSHDPVYLPGRGTLYFKCFETWKMEEFLTLTKEHSLVTKGRALGATGGGARKFRDQFLEIAGLQLQHADELNSLVRGIDFLARHAHHESFEYPSGSFQGGVIQRPLVENSKNESDSSGNERSSSPSVKDDSFEISGDKDGKKAKGTILTGPVLATAGTGWLGGSGALYPYLVVNIGSGVSILRVDAADKFERVGGTSLGGSTFLGLTSALTGCTSFEEAINYAMEGDSTEIDMLVGDIYGGDYTEMGLAATTVASSFGKLVQPGRRESAMKSPQHLAKAVLLMVTNNIGSIAMLHAQAAGVRHIMFTGSFLHQNQLAMKLLAVAMEFWSKGNIKAVFLRHEGHAGAMGALLSTLEHSNNLLLATS